MHVIIIYQSGHLRKMNTENLILKLEWIISHYVLAYTAAPLALTWDDFA